MTDWTTLKKLALAATPGPWEWDKYRITLGTPRNNIPILAQIGDEFVCPEAEDASFIAAANPQTILDLLAENQRYREALERIIVGPKLPLTPITGAEMPHYILEWTEECARTALKGDET